MAQDTIKLILLNILGWSCYAFADTTAKHLTNYYAPSQILFSVSLIATLIFGIWIIATKGLKGFQTPKLKWHLARGLTIAATSYCVVNSVSRIPLADFYGVAFTAPFLTLIFVHFWLKEHIGWRRWISVGVGFIGVIILAGPEFAHLNAGYFFAAFAVLMIALSSICIRKIGKGEHLPLYGFYGPLCIVLLNGPLTIPVYVPYHLSDSLFFLTNGIFIVGGQLMTTYSIAHIKETAILSPFQYIQIIWGVLFGFFLFGDLPAATTYAGLVLIIGAGLYMIYREHRASHSALDAD